VTNYPCPAGGCLLTELSFVPKMQDLFDHSDDLDPRDFRLLKLGRHLRVGERTKVIIGRSEADNNLLEAARKEGEAAITWLDGNTPVGILTGRQNDESLNLAARLLLRYTKADKGADCRVSVRQNGSEHVLTVRNDLDEEAVKGYVIF
jgi:hypothetical protein